MPEQQSAHRAPLQGGDSAAPAAALPQIRRPSPWLWAALSALLLAALLVIFVLPVVVAEYELPFERRAELAELPPPVPASESQVAVSPFEEAVQARQRQLAQEVLAGVLDSQAELQRLQVGQWAAAEYEAALDAARDGDEFYGSQQFGKANASYQQAAELLEGLLAGTPERLARFLADGEAALLAGDPAAATQSFNMALLLDVANADALAGLARAANYEQLAGLLAEASEFERSGALPEALDAYRGAAALDPGNESARAGIVEIAAKMLDAEFSAAMSAGFALLDTGDPEGAIAEFERAAGLGVRGDEAQAAIEQTRNEVASVEIRRLRGSIEAAEQAEQWQQAVEGYDQVLAIDANVVFAIEGRQHAGRRSQLDELLTEAIANPWRFNEDSVYQQALDVYYTGRAIEFAGPKLAGQLDELEKLLANSQVPVTVRFVSDNLTSVTILRVVELGTFRQSDFTLKPGRYVATGSRPGYRDVREEFVVGFGQTPENVRVECVEPLGGRR